MSDLLYSDKILPVFSKIEVQNIEPEIKSIIKDNQTKLQKIKQRKSLTDFVTKLEELEVRLANAWSPVSHMNSVVSNKELRQAYENSLQEIIQYNLQIGQDEGLYSSYKSLFESLQKEQHIDLSKQVTLKLLEHKLRDFKLTGVELDKDKQEEFKKICQELSKHSTTFSNNVMDCTDEWTYHIVNEHLLDGIPSDILEIARNRAKESQHDGYLFGLDAPTYLAIVKNAKSRELRSAFHYAHSTRASKKGPHDEKYDNTAEMYNILLKRYRKAKMLGYKSYAEYSLATKMVSSPEVVLDFLSKLLDKAKPFAKKELDELKLFASTKDKLNNLMPWDLAYYSELQKNKLFNLSDEELKQYFPLYKVLKGLFSILNTIYCINFIENNSADKWHPDVICYDVLDNNDHIIGHIYLDLFARLHKRNGAWMDECRVKCNTNDVQQNPVAYLTCNFNKPSEGHIALLTHYDVLTLFHEFGHCLHHLLTNIELPSISGINGVPWDAVELPSQIHENWCWSHESLPLISEHFESKASLPEKLLNQLQKQKNYQAGMFLLRQITFALFDFKLHLNFHPDKGQSQIQQTLDEVRAEVEVLPYAEYDQFQHSFSHIFAGGYAAGYYSYLWAEVLAANCFEKFKTNGIFDQNTGLEFVDKILSKGGSIDFNQAVESFCGGKVKIEPLLVCYGIK